MTIRTMNSYDVKTKVYEDNFLGETYTVSKGLHSKVTLRPSNYSNGIELGIDLLRQIVADFG